MADCSVKEQIAAICKLRDQLNHLEYHLCHRADRNGRLILKPATDNHVTAFRVIHRPTETQSVKNFDKCKQWRWGDTFNGFGANVVKLMGESRVTWHSKRKTLTLRRGAVDIDELYSTIDSLALQAAMAARFYGCGRQDCGKGATCLSRKRRNDDAATCSESSQPPSRSRRTKSQSLTRNRNDRDDATGEASDDNTSARHDDGVKVHEDMEEACNGEKEARDDGVKDMEKVCDGEKEARDDVED